MTPTSRYLDRPLRTEEEARQERQKNCLMCHGEGKVIREHNENLYGVPCPICNPSREEDDG